VAAADTVRFVHPPQDGLVAIELHRQLAELRARYGGIIRARFPYGSYPYGNSEGWVAIGYEEVKFAFSDPRFELFGHRTQDYPRMLVNQADKPPRPLTFVMMDGEAHRTRRQLLMKHLTHRRAALLRPTVQAMADDLIDQVIAAGPGADLIEMYARQIPIAVVCDLLGVPAHERVEFVPAAVDIANGRVKTVEESDARILQIRSYFQRLAARRRQDFGDDLLSALIKDAQAAEWAEEEIEGIGHQLLQAGHDAPSAILGGMLYVLAHSPALYDELRGRRADVKQAVEEFLRYAPAGTGTRTRIAAQDIDAFGVHIRRGEVVQPLVHAANFDDAMFHDPESVETTRADAPHLRFGHGPHVCPGAQVARMELEVALQTVLTRFAVLRAVPAEGQEDRDWRLGMLIRGPRELRVEWELA
jgi:cytochrome P450